MPDLDFAVTGAEVIADSASPAVAFRLRIADGAPAPVRSLSLRCQIRIESPRRRYAAREQARLVDLFGESSRWGETLRSLLWTNADVVAGPFEGLTEVELPVACTYDFNVSVAKYFDALDDGDVPLQFLFSGSVFYTTDQGILQVAPIPWNRECTYRLPVHIWKSMMELYYPNSAWLCLRKDVFDRLHEYKMRNGIATWEQTLENILVDVDRHS